MGKSHPNCGTNLGGRVENLGTVLNKAGLSLDDVIEPNSYHTDMTSERFFQFLDVKDKYLKEPYPAWNGIGVDALPLRHAKASIAVKAIKK